MANVHQLKNGRWIVAHWSDAHSEWQSSNIERVPFQGYVYSVARSLEGLASVGIRTYSTRASAGRAARRVYEGR